MLDRTPQEKVAAWGTECPDTLIPREAFERLSRAAAHVPASVTGFFAECHLADANRTDLIARMHRWDRDALISSGSVPARITSFVDWWVRRGDAEGAVLAIDLEWDLALEGTDFFVCPLFEPGLTRGHFGIHRRERARRARGMHALAYDLGPEQLLALDPNVPSASLNELRRAVANLPTYGVLIPGWPGSTRPESIDRGIRVIVSLPKFEARRYLSELGWGGDLDTFDRAADLLCDGQTFIGFDADISQTGLGARVALYREIFCAGTGDPELMATIDRIRARGLCHPERLDGLHAWLISRDSTGYGPGAKRSLSLKLVLDGPGEPVIKAYLSSFDELDALGMANSAAKE